jgi:hypothetical protein
MCNSFGVIGNYGGSPRVRGCAATLGYGVERLQRRVVAYARISRSISHTRAFLTWPRVGVCRSFRAAVLFWPRTQGCGTLAALACLALGYHIWAFQAGNGRGVFVGDVIDESEHAAVSVSAIFVTP